MRSWMICLQQRFQYKDRFHHLQMVRKCYCLWHMLGEIIYKKDSFVSASFSQDFSSAYSDKRDYINSTSCFQDSEYLQL